MPTQDVDRDTTWRLTTASQEWILAGDATIAVDESVGIDDDAFSNSIVVLGTIRAAGVSSSGVSISARTSSLTVGSTGVIDCSAGGFGVLLDGTGINVVNEGLISGRYRGISGIATGKIENTGTIIAETGIFYESAVNVENSGVIAGFTGIESGSGGAFVSNLAGGNISGTGYGIALVRDSGPATIVNEGVIRGGNAAIYCEGTLNLTNSGRIFGDLLLSVNGDRIDTRKGEIHGAIYGGDGDDLYLISKSDTDIRDNGSSFHDKVMSSASYTLVGGLDHLDLIGRRNVNGTGNAGVNDMEGNAGNNRLSGMDGVDFLNGGRGKDVMIGGNGEDVFLFNKRDGVDIVLDFVDGVDRLASESINTQRDFNRLDIRQVEDDVVIDFGQGDRLILRDTMKADIGYSDFEV